MSRAVVLGALAALALAGCTREEWMLDTEVPLFRNQVACGFDAQRNDRDAVQLRLSPGQTFTVRRRELVEEKPCWLIRTSEGLDGWMVFALGRAHRLR